MLGALLSIAVALEAGRLPPAPLFDPASGYRIAAYRGVVPVPPPGIARLDDAAAAAAYDAGKTLFVDVGPAPGGQRDAASGAWRLAEPHLSIVGAHWFPEAGRGPADAAIDLWFAQGLRRLTHGAKGRPIIVFCLADCWMSWNAGWKLRRLGYTHVAWYANGTDGWRDLGRPLVVTTPEPDVAR